MSANEQWDRVQGLFLQAIELPAEERGFFLDKACREDPELRREIDSLLAHDTGAEAIAGVIEQTIESFLHATTLKPGTRVGDYEIQKLIGAGGMGEVYQARDARLARDVAIKVLPPFLTSHPERLRRFEQEARAAAALNHPNILAVYQMGVYDGAPYLVSELLEGSTLREHIQRGPLPPRRTIEYGMQIVRGLTAAHNKGIVHRDLKPENVFVTQDGHMKILDFGLAKLTSTDTPAADGKATETGLAMGTAGYMSPEQVRGQAADYRADFFAFGAILFEMLSGKRAFQKPTAAETMSAILNEEPPDISQVLPAAPPTLQRIVRRCLEKQREQRFQSASDLAFALEALSDSESFAVTTRKEGHARWRNLILFAVVIAVVIAVLGIWWKSPAPAPKVESVRQLTDDGAPKATTYESSTGSLASDGSRLYFNEKQSGNWRIAQVSTVGGQSAILDTAIPEPIIAGMDPDSANLLTLNGWLLPVPAGNPRRLGDLANLALTAAEFFPDGQHIIYASGSTIYIADKNGDNSRKLLEVPGEVRWLSVSPDGKRIRFTFIDEVVETIWEIKADGTGQHELIKGLNGLNMACCGKWTKDGKYFVFLGVPFLGSHARRFDVWALPEESRPLGVASPAPTQLTSGPLSFYEPLPSNDNKTVFVVGAKQKGELSRFDSIRGEFVPFLGGTSATDVAPSRDGQWAVFLSYPDGILWRSHPDGSDRIQLSAGKALFPRISPDGSKVLFVGFDRRDGLSAYVESTQGGTPRRVLEKANFADWSPDGNQLVYQSGEPHLFQGPEIRTADLRTGQMRVIPGSRGMTNPFWPNSDTLVAGSSAGLMAFDLNTQKWSPLATGDIDNWAPSWDGKYVYFERPDGSGRKAFRIRLDNHHTEPIADLSSVRRVEKYGQGTWLGVAYDGSVLITRDIGTQEIYALDVKWP
jgi:serine/threonine protein kinase/Tol biopolymer transport system component